MAITFVAAGTAIGTTSTSWSVDPPAGFAAGDLLVIASYVGNESGNGTFVADPSGWTPFFGSGTGSGNSYVEVMGWYKVAAGGETAVTLNGGGTGQSKYSVMVAFTGNANTSPCPQQSAGSNTGSPASVASVTTTSVNNLIVHLFSTSNDTASSVTGAATNGNLTGITEHFGGATTLNGGGTLSVISGTKATAGAVGNSSIPFSVLSGSEWSCITFSIVPGASYKPTLLLSI